MWAMVLRKFYCDLDSVAILGVFDDRGKAIRECEKYLEQNYPNNEKSTMNPSDFLAVL